MLQTLQTLETLQPLDGVDPASLPTGVGVIERLKLQNGLDVMINRHRLERDVIATVEGQDLLKFHVQLSGARTLKFQGRHESSLAGASTVVLMHDEGVTKLERLIGEQDERSVTTMVARERMREYLEEEQIQMPSELHTLIVRRRSTPRMAAASPTKQEREAVDAIIDCRRSGPLRRMYIEAKVTELFFLVLDRLQADSGGPAQKSRVTERDRRQLAYVREFLSATFTNPPTVHQLARQFGLNRNKLCGGFLLVYGVTIFDFCSSLRLEQARQLLAESNATIAEIAVTTGYATASAFSTAFQRRFGHSPKQSRQGRALRAIEVPVSD